MDGLPVAGGGGVNVFLAIVDVEEIGTAQLGEFLDELVNARRWFHHAMFIGQNVAVEFVEEGKTLFDETNAEIVRVGENVAWYFFRAQLFVP